MANYLNNQDVIVLNYGRKTIILIGTAHISKISAELVSNIISSENPETVCIELDQQRFDSLSNKTKWQNLDVKTLIKNKQLSTLFLNILLASYQKKLGKKLGVNPGVELLEAIKTAQKNNINVALCDRDVRITLKRAWRSMSFIQKSKFLSMTFASIFDNKELSEKELEELKQKDMLSELMNELGKSLPILKRVLVDERDSYLAKKIKEADGNKIVAVVGAGHLIGIEKKISENEEINISSIEQIPDASPFIKIVGWTIPIIIIGALFVIGFTKGYDEAGGNLLFWILANGIPSAFGALIAWAHPITILSVFIAAPLTSLTPLIGAGYVAAFVQYFFKPPLVFEIESVIEDVNIFKKWWTNKFLRIFLVFFLSGIGSVVGTYLGAYKIITNLF